MRVFIIATVSILFSISSIAQAIFSGTIIDAESKKTLGNVYVENTSRHLIVESDKNGHFEIFSQFGDTLVFSSIGYFWAKHIVTEENHLTFHLSPQIYDIETVTKYFPFSYEELTQRVLSMKPVEDSLQLNLDHEPFLPTNNHQPGQLSYTLTGAITDIYNSTNRHARNALKAAELLSHKENILIMNKKFNKAMVVEMTHIPDAYFDKFIAFCNFSDDFLVNTSDFQIIMTICWQYERFTEEHPELKNSLN